MCVCCAITMTKCVCLVNIFLVVTNNGLVYDLRPFTYHPCMHLCLLTLLPLLTEILGHPLFVQRPVFHIIDFPPDLKKQNKSIFNNPEAYTGSMMLFFVCCQINLLLSFTMLNWVAQDINEPITYTLKGLSTYMQSYLVRLYLYHIYLNIMCMRSVKAIA